MDVEKYECDLQVKIRIFLSVTGQFCLNFQAN